MPIMAVPSFERFFRAAASLDVDKDDLKQFSDFINDQIYDLLVVAVAKAKANGRDVVEPWDLPITKGLQESIHKFRRLDEEIELEPILKHLATRRPLEATVSEETEARLPEVAGGVSFALAQTFTIIDTNVKNPQTAQWERAFRVFDLLL